jgi:uncharacterized protein (TIGR03435 family)
MQFGVEDSGAVLTGSRKQGTQPAGINPTARFLLIASVSLVCPFRGPAQDSVNRLDYEVASIRASADHRNGTGVSGGPGSLDPTRIRYGFFPLRLLLTAAYDMNVHQISLPDRLESGDRYDIIANVRAGATRDQEHVMLQNFLIDRFHLKLHREARNLAHYELRVSRNGLRLKRHEAGAPASGGVVLRDGDIGVKMAADRNHMFGSKIPISEMVRVLSDELATPVLDKTGLTGEYDIDFEYSREGLDGFRRSLADPPEASGARTLQIALQESLGLKLESVKGPLEILVVDSGDKVPSGN